MSEAYDQFLDQMTRKLLVDWCLSSCRRGGFPLMPENDTIFIDYAVSKGWLSKDKTRINASGWKTAAAFLKR